MGCWMAGNGGSGTLNPPSDDDVAPVIPLRQRQATLAPPAPRRALPRERAAFDPELEPGDVALRRRPLVFAAAIPLRASARRRLVTPARSRPRDCASGRRCRAARALGSPDGRTAWDRNTFAALRLRPGFRRLGCRRSVDQSAPARNGREASGRPRCTQPQGPVLDRVPARVGARRSTSHRTRSRHHRSSAAASRTGATTASASSTVASTANGPTSSSTSSTTAPPTPVTQNPAQSTPASGSSSASTSSSHHSAVSKRPAFGAYGTLGPGSSPDG